MTAPTGYVGFIEPLDTSAGHFVGVRSGDGDETKVRVGAADGWLFIGPVVLRIEALPCLIEALSRLHERGLDADSRS